MANQPKKYKKFVATAATATLVASAIVPVASAKSFSDVPANNEFQPFIDALSDAGIINGYADGTFKPGAKLTRGQVVKMLGRWVESNGTEIPSDWNTKQRFNDVPVNGADSELVKYAALVKDAGVFTGSNGNLLAGNNITRQQMAKVLNGAYAAVNGVSLVDLADAIDNKLVTDLASSQQEFEGYIQALVDLEISTVSVFRPSENVTRAQFAKFLYNTINLEAVAAAGVKAINNTTVEVTFEDAIEDIKALDFKIEGLEVKNAVVKQTDANTAVLTTAAQEGGKEYTVSVNGEEVGSFTGISAVIPTKIDVTTKSVQGVVGKEVTLKATVTVPEGASKADIPVTFNIDAANNNLNKDIVAEVKTDANGVATYTYTQYAAANDSVAVYATGAPANRDFAVVRWGVKPILSVTTTEGETTANGTAKVYTATYLDQATGAPLANRTLTVTLAENINASVTDDSNATITDPATGINVKPFESSTDQRVLTITTNSKGEATFTVTGANTSATPIVYVDELVNNTLNGNKRLGATELQVTAQTVKFVGATYTFKFDKETQVEGVVGKAFEYEVQVLKADGKPYAGGTATLALNELIDNSLATTTEAYIVDTATDALTAISGKAGVYKLALDSEGKAKFSVRADRPEVSATPVVWVDINSASNVEGSLESEESFKLAGSVVFRNEVISSAKLTQTIKNVYGVYGVSSTSLTQPNYQITLLDQAGSTYSKNDYAINRVTYTLTNTGNSEVNVTLTANNFGVDSISNFAGTPSVTTNTLTIAAGQSVTIAGTAIGNVKNVSLDVANSKAGQLNVTGSATARTTSAATTTETTYFAAGSLEATWVNANAYAGTGAELTGTVKGYQTADLADGSYGYVIVQIDGSTGYGYVKYDSTVGYFAGTQTDFNRLTSTDVNAFERALSVDDRLSFKNNELRLINVDSSSKPAQVSGNGTGPTPTITRATLVTAKAATAAAPAKYESAVVGSTNFSTSSFEVGISTASTATVTIAGTDTAAEIAAKINTALATVTTDVTATVSAGRVVLTAKNTTTSIVVQNSGVPTLFNNITINPTPATAAVAGQEQYTFTSSYNIAVGNTVTVNGRVYTAGTVTAGTTFDATGAIATDLANLATVVSFNDTQLTATSATNTITLTERTPATVTFTDIVVQ